MVIKQIYNQSLRSAFSFVYLKKNVFPSSEPIHNDNLKEE